MEATMNDELFDEELCGMVNFKDSTKTAKKQANSDRKTDTKKCAEKKKTVKNAKDKPMEADWEPVKTWYDPKIVNLVKWTLIFIVLEYIFFYWKQTGQMQPSAAVPSMIVCALLAGISVGKNWKWRN